MHHKEDEETNPSARKATNTAQPRARDSLFAYSAWARHLSPVLANTLNYDDNPQRLDRKTRASLNVFFRDIVILMRDIGMRNQRELCRVRIENLDWENRVIFVPESRTPEGRRLVPMSRRVLERLRAPCCTRAEGLGVSVQAFCCGSPSLNRSAVSKGAATSRPPEGTGPFIVPAMITALESSCGPGTLAAVMRTMGHRDVKDCDALSAPRH